MAMLWTHNSIAQTYSPEVLDPAPRFEVSVGELKVPGNVWSRLQAAHKALSEGNLEKAAKNADGALQIDAECSPIFSMKALIDLARRKPVDAVQDATRAASIDPHDVEAFVVLAMAENSAAHFADGEQAARKALSLRPNSWQADLELAESLYGEEQFDAALAELDQLGKDFPDVHLVKANVLMRLGRTNQAVSEFRVFLREAPGDPRVSAIQQIITQTATPPGS